MSELRTPGLALLCDRAGVIQKVLCDDVFPAGDVHPGQRLTDRIDQGSREKAGHLLAAVIAQGSAFDWELNVSFHSRVLTLHFSGVADEASLLIVAAHNRDNLLQFNAELMRINSEQVNALRQAIKDQTTLALMQDRRCDSSTADAGSAQGPLPGSQQVTCRAPQALAGPMQAGVWISV